MSKGNSLKTRSLRFGLAEISKLAMALVFISAIFIPLFSMFANIGKDDFQKVIQSPVFERAVTNSLVSAVIGTVITVTIAFVLAICIHRTTIKFKSVFGIIFVLPMLIPSISSGMGLQILFGNNGIITKLLNLNGNIYGLTGIVVGSVMYSFPVAYLMLADIIGYEDGSPYEAAQVLGVPKWRQFTGITLPYLRKPLISVVFAVFSLIITDYGVPLMVGGKYTTIA
ncbi:MAG: ABC transporter permease subunit, partial [Clostridia bacterium]|nr:ABC transporter permease subunit [Clostridia bacterium]